MRSLTLIVVLSLAACGSSSKPKPEPIAKELQKASTKAVDTPETDLVREAKSFYGSGLFSVARETFESVRDTYPSGPYAELARLKIADTYFETGDYGTAATTYEEFLKGSPASPSVPYAMLRAGRSHHLSSRGAGRDVTPIEKARDQYDSLISKYPDSPYASAAKEFRKAAVQTLGDHEQFVAQYYEKQEKPNAALARARNYENTTAELRTRTAPTQPATAPTDDPSTPVVVAAGRVSRDTFRASPKLSSFGNVADTIAVQRVSCERDNGRRIFLYLNQEIDEAGYVRRITKAPVPNAALGLRLPRTTANPSSIDCFGEQDLALSGDGLLTISGVSRVEVISLSAPPRLLLTVK
jgi:outer membrane protein assembly factor BamD